MGRFLSRDPLVGLGTLPLSLNRFSYALNNPVNATDPSGFATSAILRNVQSCLDPTQQHQTLCAWLLPHPGLPGLIQSSIGVPKIGANPGEAGGSASSAAEDATAGGGAATKVYRALSPGEDPTLGIWARDPEAANSPISHIAGQQQSQWISTSKDPNVALTKYGGSTNGVVEIDLTKVRNQVVDLSNGIPGVRGMLSNWAKKDQEVLVQGYIPPEAMRKIVP